MQNKKPERTVENSFWMIRIHWYCRVNDVECDEECAFMPYYKMEPVESIAARLPRPSQDDRERGSVSGLREKPASREK